MTGLTHVRGRDVRGANAAGGRAIVTGDAGVAGGAVIKHHTQPRRRDVAHITRGSRWNMRSSQARGDAAIVTRNATSRYLGVID